MPNPKAPRRVVIDTDTAATARGQAMTDLERLTLNVKSDACSKM